ncbi:MULTISPECIES: FAD-dependent 2-octaprenylphenol hydroxylase [Dickeya]|uniref:2-octaprenyl-3-methyl-6-methoxy-1,4-benzoquinol hydroxylase n=1 Tax=Dickeya aquatica TaxID=1401087 RepID=A0A375A6G6_9GAMM|nr:MULTISPECIES: FAD-dependent 2-octaprenylphenol hydroxylase [Dickeya]SLM61644.1 2-octaprenyl-3-methyl-6-methoxy-1,4-benzoquinol hydroxylase [Dickeya aquatica]
MQSFDVVIAGGGMVGLALACGLQGSGLRVAVLEKHTVSAPSLSSQYALRVSAINAASEALLRKLNVWPLIEAQRLSPYNDMYVWDKDSFGQIHFCGEDLSFTRLGHIIENDVIQWALWQQAAQSRDVTLLDHARLQQVAWGENEAFITLEDGSMLTARLVVGADGAHSWLRQHADIPLTFWDYGHHALVATIRTGQPHAATASQVFHGDGILAFLPLSDPHLCSIVWSLPPERAQEMQHAPQAEFEKQLAITFDMHLGRCTLESERQSVPLTARYAHSFAAHRLVLMGDAAHTIHPLAGQGVNLGMMDAAELITELKRLQAQGKDIGQHLYLRRYERRRKHSAAMMLASMQGFRTLFASRHPVSGLLRDIGLKLADTLPGVKPTLVRQAMGLHDLPAWLGHTR